MSSAEVDKQIAESGAPGKDEPRGYENWRQQSPLDLIRSTNELFDTGEEGEISFVRATLRCLGHCAVGTKGEDIPGDAEIPPVNPWKLAKTLAKSAVSRSYRREMMVRVKEGMRIGDPLGLLLVLGVYDNLKRSGLSKKEAQSKAWGEYAKLGEATISIKGEDE